MSPGVPSGGSQATEVRASLPAECFNTPWLLAVQAKPAAPICLRKGVDRAPSAGHRPPGGCPKRRVWLARAAARCASTRERPPGYSGAAGSGHSGHASRAALKSMSSGASGCVPGVQDSSTRPLSASAR